MNRLCKPEYAKHAFLFWSYENQCILRNIFFKTYVILNSSLSLFNVIANACFEFLPKQKPLVFVFIAGKKCFSFMTKNRTAFGICVTAAKCGFNASWVPVLFTVVGFQGLNWNWNCNLLLFLWRKKKSLNDSYISKTDPVMSNSSNISPNTGWVKVFRERPSCFALAPVSVQKPKTR